METVVHNPSELGRLASQTRTKLGLRQSDLHAYTKLATRFIGEVEHGKETAQIGKVMEMLESMGLELVVRPKSDKTKVNPHQLGLSKVRFWSSGDQLPANRVIARVLADPTEGDLLTLKHRFGMSLILSTWTQLRERHEVAKSVIPVTNHILRKLAIA
jgi:transcriptional regulator with XRE-family HTH domain